ncbi:MAG TPA: hypothetical protein VKU38_18935 [Ktedonobacteraceae bacterium]|nr:hypothetical protein [Ktedonobacteraceae bacterium]
MQEIPIHRDIENDYDRGYQRIMRYAEYARLQGWQLSDRQLVNEILHHERAATIREKSSLPIVGSEVHSPAWYRGQADALRHLLREQRKRSR